MKHTPSTGRRPLRIGVVGCGWAGQRAIEAALAVPRTTCVAFADLDDDRRAESAQAFAEPRAYGDYRDLLADPDVDAVYLATNPQVRTPMAIDSFGAGKHTLVQKPHALRASDVRRIERAAIRADRILQFCFFMRHYPVHRKLRSQLLKGAIGHIYHGRIFVQFNEDLAHSDADYWLYAYGRMGGALAQHASHELDLAWWYMGCPRPRWAFATKHSPYCRYRGPEGPAEDFFSGLIGFEGDHTIQIEATRMSHLKMGRQFHLFGAEGAVEGTTISRFDGKRKYVEKQVKPTADRRAGSGSTFFYEVEHFAAAVAGEREPDVNPDNSFVYMKMLEALYRSAATDQRVSIRL